jgi:hypothetical protein
MGCVYFAPENFFAASFAVSALPEEWVKMMKEESQASIISKAKARKIKASPSPVKIPTHDPSGKRYTTEERNKMLKFAHVKGKLLEPTASNRMAGMES